MELINRCPYPPLRQIRQVAGIWRHGLLVLSPALPVLAAGLKDALQQGAARLQTVGVLGPPVGGQLAGDGGLEDGLAIASQQLLYITQTGLAMVQLGE
ncbi:hypothetical protein BDK63_003688 [Halomonas campaniensis]|uniref:Uncharacterized protein n=1 Tax=Halomonas campaniensis TaxID=213554 RepID=A0A7W5PCF4_9GAMM|nr:hypothetical protein [Halomonas campaniensis]MBB3332783.1 hypothetical protein [Halomonas campaniensis]